VGETLRDFSALDENGERFELASTAGRPVLLKFFRGHW
jgi:peroxiredoxin